ncbi:MAG: hypothetical protein F4246_12715 [Rhodothermaceae bacterium]|nr:hypothetical protein [Rhodothermaceae bacterium]MYI43292.1 hypothetical protein [Rhodothermaceae bacterium]
MPAILIAPQPPSYGDWKLKDSPASFLGTVETAVMLGDPQRIWHMIMASSTSYQSVNNLVARP